MKMLMHRKNFYNIIRKVNKGGFHAYMKSIGKFGGQNKIPQLSDHRKIADVLQNFLK